MQNDKHSIKSMALEGRPYKHGIVIKGLTAAFMFKQRADFLNPKEFIEKVSKTLEVRPNENVHNSSMDLKLQSVGDHAESFLITDDFFVIPEVSPTKKRKRSKDSLTKTI
jgi:hypothetical protein